MKTLGESTATILEINPSGFQQQTHTSPNTHSQEDKNRLAKTLAIVCSMQQQFGKTAAEFESMVEGICFSLPDRSMDQIIHAIQKYVKKSNSIPTAADIENIINPPRPKPNWPAYIALRKRISEGHFCLSTEREFLAECDRYARENLKEEQDNYNEAQRQIAVHTKALEFHE
jgi:hypothetical protein